MKIFQKCCLLCVILVYQKMFAEFYLEPYVGVLFGAEKYQCLTVNNIYDINGLTGFLNRCQLKMLKTRPLCGLRCGGWFSQKNSFGLWLDCQYHHLDYGKWACTWVNYIDTTSENAANNPAVACANTCINTRGFAVTLALPFAYRWRFHEKDYAPFGSRQLYLAVGPGLFLTKQCMSLTVCPHAANDTNFTVVVQNTKIINSSQKKLNTAVCLVIDGGFSYFVSRHCAIDFALNYRFTKYNLCFNKCVCLSAKKICHLGSATLGLVFDF